MGLAAYFSRISDAVGGVADVTPDQLDSILGATVIRVEIGASAADEPALRDGALLLTNLLARLYPRLELTGPRGLASDCAALAEQINPNIHAETPVRPSAGAATRGVAYAAASADAEVSVDVDGWTVFLDQNVDATTAPSSFSALAAACLAAGELFRVVFSSSLGSRGRTDGQPGSFSLTTGPVPSAAAGGLQLPPLHLAGAGAIGQACILALTASGATGTITVVDPEHLELSNLQRYVLASPADVGTLKVDLAERSLAAAGWTVHALPTTWGADPRTGPRRDTVLVALDTARDRLAIAGGLHRRVYNAWTQPADLGWSRHEAFGTEPCLACLYYPDRPRPNDDELVAQALGQHRLRVLSYFTTRVPIGAPLPVVAAVADIPPPPGAEMWTTTPLLTDLVTSGMVAPDQSAACATKSIGQLYRDGICGGGLIRPTGGAFDPEVAVPLAHQSALAGVMLAFEVFAAHTPELAAHRSTTVESRYDMLAGLPQVLARPRARTRGCICSDPDYLHAMA